MQTFFFHSIFIGKFCYANEIEIMLIVIFLDAVVHLHVDTTD